MRENPLLSIASQKLYDGTGAHIGGVFPPLAVNNVLTDAFHEEKAHRPAVRLVQCDPVGANLGLVWLVPRGLTRAGPIPGEVIGALVQAIDHGYGVALHAETGELAKELGELVLTFAGGGHV